MWICIVINRVNFRGVITPVLGFFDVFTPFLIGWGVVLRLKFEVRRVAVCAAVEKSGLKLGTTWHLGVFSAFGCVFECVCGVKTCIFGVFGPQMCVLKVERLEKFRFAPPSVVSFFRKRYASFWTDRSNATPVFTMLKLTLTITSIDPSFKREG